MANVHQFPTSLMATFRVWPPKTGRNLSDLAGTHPTAPARARHSQHLGRGHATKRLAAADGDLHFVPTSD